MANRTPRSARRRRVRSTRSVAAASASRSLATALRRACKDLASVGADYAIVGGLAVSARAEPRLTRDVDLAVAVADDAAAEGLVGDLRARGYRVVSAVEQTSSNRLATVRLHPPGAKTLVVDLLFASCGIEREIVDAADRLEILPRLTVPVATAAHLIAMKLLARDDRSRPQDLDDIVRLVPTLDPGGVREVTRALSAITERGYARGRDLARAWRALTRTKRSTIRR